MLECSFSEMRLLRDAVKNCVDFLVQTLQVYTHAQCLTIKCLKKEKKRVRGEKKTLKLRTEGP